MPDAGGKFKTCSKCRETKPLVGFAKDRSRADGLRYMCRTCSNEISRKWGAENPERVRENKRKWNAANPERVREANRERKRKWRAANPEAAREAARENNRKWNAANPERVRENNRKRAVACRKILHEFKAHPCVDCGNTYGPAVMHFDHVHGEKLGRLGRLVYGSRKQFLAELAKCELRCANCHAIRHANERSEAAA